MHGQESTPFGIRDFCLEFLSPHHHRDCDDFHTPVGFLKHRKYDFYNVLSSGRVSAFSSVRFPLCYTVHLLVCDLVN